MSWESGSASGHADLLTKLNAFLKKGHSLPISYTGTGNGVLSGLIGTVNSVQETITVTWSSATAFSVSGSVTGSMGSGTVGTLFSHARVAFTAVAGGTAWASGATASFVMTPPWATVRETAGTEYIWRAPGNGGTDQIFVGAITFSNASADYYNWRLGGFIGYTEASAFASQPGACSGPVLPLWNSTIPYWFIASGKRVIVIAKISTAYEMAYLGFIDAYASPNQWPYPLFVGGSMAFNSEPAATSTSWRWSSTDGLSHNGFPFGAPNDTPIDAYHPGRLRKMDGTWRGFARTTNAATAYVWPYGFGMTDVRPNLDGSYPLFPVCLGEDIGSTENAFGELSGVSMVTGHANAAENTITIGRDTWLVVPNIARSAKSDYCAFRLD